MTKIYGEIMKNLLDEHKGEYVDLEVYRVMDDHFDGIRWEETKYVEEYDKNECIRDYFLMDEEEYFRAFQFPDGIDFTDLYGSPDVKVMVVVLWKRPKYIRDFRRNGFIPVGKQDRYLSKMMEREIEESLDMRNEECYD